MAVVVIPASEGLAALAAAVVAALGARELVEAEGATPRAKERDCADTPDDTECKQCRLGTGMLGQASQPRFINANNLINYRYQLYIANLYAAPERFVFTRFRDETNEEVNMVWERLKASLGADDGPLTTTEWLYNGIWFDGFWRRYCTVVEAKGNYAWMFPEAPRKEPFFAKNTLEDWIESYRAQEAALASAKPRAKIEWHFMQEGPWLKAVESALPVYAAKFTPPPTFGM